MVKCQYQIKYFQFGSPLQSNSPPTPPEGSRLRAITRHRDLNEGQQLSFLPFGADVLQTPDRIIEQVMTRKYGRTQWGSSCFSRFRINESVIQPPSKIFLFNQVSMTNSGPALAWNHAQLQGWPDSNRMGLQYNPMMQSSVLNMNYFPQVNSPQ